MPTRSFSIAQVILALFLWSAAPVLSDDDPVDMRMQHAPGVDKIAACTFAPMPHGLNATAILEDLLPRLKKNELSYNTFGETRSVKWRFSAQPGAMEMIMDKATAAWARPLVDAWSGDTGADLFLLNGLSVPCGASVAAHYDDTVATEHTPLRVSVLYLSSPVGQWSGGMLRAYTGRGPALKGEPPVCDVEPSLLHSVHFRGNLFHGITELVCGEGTSGERISVVLEHYDMGNTPMSISVGVNSVTHDLRFGAHNTSDARKRAAEEFAIKHGLMGGMGCEGEERCVVDVLEERMDVIIDAQREARGEHHPIGSTDDHLPSSVIAPARAHQVFKHLGRDAASDTRQLSIAPSSLPAVHGSGVFATETLEAGAIACEMRGHVLEDDEDIGDFIDRTHRSLGRKVAQGGVCSLINDCRNLETHPGVHGGGQPWHPGREDYCWRGYEWNCKMIVEDRSGKFFVQTLRRIEAGEELFYDYGECDRGA